MLAAGQVPDPHRFIVATGDQMPPIWAESNAEHGLGMTLHTTGESAMGGGAAIDLGRTSCEASAHLHDGHALSAGHVPHPRRPVSTAGRQLAPIFGVCHALHWSGVTLR